MLRNRISCTLSQWLEILLKYKGGPDKYGSAKSIQDGKKEGVTEISPSVRFFKYSNCHSFNLSPYLTPLKSPNSLQFHFIVVDNPYKIDISDQESAFVQQYLNFPEVRERVTMHTQSSQLQSQNMSIDQYLSKSSLLQQKLKILHFLQLNNHNAIIIILHSIKILSLLHILLSYLMIETELFAVEVRNAVQGVVQNQVLYRTVQGVIYFVKAVKLISVIIAFRQNVASLSFRIVIKILKYIIIISEIDLLLTSLLLLMNFKENIIAFVTSAVLNAMLNILLENYSNRKLENYHSSQISYLVYKVIQISLYFVNSIVAAVGVTFYFYLMNCIISLFVFKWYWTSGLELYVHSRPKKFTMWYISFYFTLIFLFVERFLLRTDIFSYISIAKIIIISIAIFAFWYVVSQKRSVHYQEIKILVGLGQRMKKIDLGFFMLFRQVSYNFDIQSFLIGLFRFHKDSICLNDKCFTHFESFYDPNLKKQLPFMEGLKEKEPSSRFYVKCLYQQCLSFDSSLGLLLDYCEFLLNESLDFYEITRIFKKIELFKLNMFDTIRYFRMKIALQEENKIVNNLIYDGKLEIEKIMKAEETFHAIHRSVMDYINHSLSIWDSLNKLEVNLSEIRMKMRQNLAIIDEINEKWAAIFPYLALQKMWRFFKMNYSIFILNEKIRHKEMEDSQFLSLHDEDNKDALFLENEINNEKLLYSKAFLFDKNTMYLHAILEHGVVYILNTNKSFLDISKYRGDEINGVELKQLLPNQIRDTHDKAAVDWLEKGETNNEDAYPVRFTELKIRGGILIPVIKYFKIIINIDSTKKNYLQFVCMLKYNTKEMVESDDQPHFPEGKKPTFCEINEQFLEKQGKSLLKSQSNIFIKEQNLKAKHDMHEIKKIKRGMRLLLIVLIMMTIGLNYLTNRDATYLNSYSIEYINFLNLYRYPMAFGKNVLKTMLNVGNQTKATNQIYLEVVQITGLMADTMTLESIFDLNLNLPKTYYPFQNNSFNRGIGYNQIDLIYYMVSCIQSLNRLPANRTGEYFTNFNMYITPYDQLINSTKIQFHSYFRNIFTSMINNQVTFLVLEMLTFVLGMIYINFHIYQYFKKTKENLKIIIEFTEEEIQGIIIYLKKLQLFLTNFNQTKRTFIKNARDLVKLEYKKEMLQKEKENHKEISLNKKNKNIFQSKKETIRTIKIIVVVLVLKVMILLTITSFQITNMVTIDNIHVFEEDGFYFLRYFPATSVLGHAILERYYSQVYPKEIKFYPQRYAESISDLTLIGHADYIGNIQFPDSVYFQDQKNYLFGNPCTFNPSVLVAAQTAMSKCQSIYNSTFSRGITTFLRACEPQVINYLNGKINLTSSQVDELTTTLTLVAYYITDAIMAWSSELSTMIVVFKSHNNLLCIIICIVLLIFHLYTCEGFIFPYLRDDYQLMRRIFNNMVPQDILINEKVIKQKFVINGILHHQ